MSSETKNYALELRDIHKVFNQGTINEKVALDGVDLQLEDGDFVTVIGGNGAGKSTMLNAIAGMWPVDSGSIIVGGADVTSLPEHKRAKFLGRVFQDPMTGTAATMSIDENMAIAARRGKHHTLRWGVTKAEREQYKEMLRELDLGLEERLTTKVGLLSGGQRQAVTLLMASLEKPNLLLLDEHTAALDPKTAATVLALSDKIIEEHHLTAMMVTHNMKDAISHGNRLVMMHEGKIIYDVRGEEKKNLHVSDLMAKFEEVSGGEFANDRMILS
ncbi:MAG: ABC transporter ATP-binding protein [Lachnospiraceae bacterium]|nr:ABC transporter ATP-binding protein [Lachnospiraceae bacterium]